MKRANMLSLLYPSVNYDMKWVTREHAKVDRIACPWLIKNFIDKDAEFLFVSSDKVMQVAKEENAFPYDVPNVELGHHGEECSFDAILKKYDLGKKHPALMELAKIVRGADTPNRTLTSQSQGLVAIAMGFAMNSKDDFDNMSKQFPVYDALYTFCKSNLANKGL
jgi:hypothetical protein